MSTSEGGVPRFADTRELGFREGIIIVAGIVALMISLLIARFMCHIMIDVCVLCDLDEARRTTIRWKDMIFPCFRRRLVNPATDDEEQNPPTNPGSEGVELSTLDATLSGLSHGAKRAVLQSILPEKIVDETDLSGWRKKHLNDSWSTLDSNSPRKGASDHSHGIVCSICLNELEVGSKACVTRPCEHVFHRDCVLDYVLSTDNATCPYCRTNMFTQSELDAAISDVVESGNES